MVKSLYNDAISAVDDGCNPLMELCSNFQPTLVYMKSVKAKFGIFSYHNKRLYNRTRLIFIFKDKLQNKKIDTKEKIYSIWPLFLSIIVSVRL